MMGYREKLKGGREWDAFTSWRYVVRWYDSRAPVKRIFRRRVRRQERARLRQLVGPLDNSHEVW